LFEGKHMNLKNRWKVKGAGGGLVVNRERFVEGSK
jgi:hypothetical protein